MIRNIFTLKGLFDFKGRATRREYFLLLAVWIAGITLPLLLLGAVVGDSNPDHESTTAFAFSMFFVAVSGLFGWVGLVVMLAAGFRRLHDQGNSAAFLLLSLIPLVGWIFLLVMLLHPGQTYENEYGPDPRDRYYSDAELA